MEGKSDQEPFKIGVLLLSQGVQMLDLAPVDMLSMIEPMWLGSVGMPEHMRAKGQTFTHHYISENGKSPFPMTGGFKIEVTHSIENCPPLDLLLIGGPAPSYRPSPAVAAFIKKQVVEVPTFMTICTGFGPALYSGVLEGKTATAPRALLPMLKEKHPEVKWVDKRWVRDGNVWTSGAVGNGMDLMGGFMRQRFDMGAVEGALGVSDVGGRGDEY